MSSEESDFKPDTQRRRKRKINTIEDSPRASPSASSSNHDSGPMSSTSYVRRIYVDDSDSDSASCIDLEPRRKYTSRVLSDDDPDSSGSTIVKRPKRPGRVMSETESDSEAGNWESDSEDSDSPKGNNPSVTVPNNGVDSDSSDGQAEKCPICLLSLRTQEIGTPECCDHVFCVDCIQEWSKNMNTCPVDRQEYRLILVRRSILGKVYRKIPIEPPNPQNDPQILENPTFCEICGSSEQEDRMLLCDGCDMGYHLHCLEPPLENVPVGAWFCPDCAPHGPEDVISQEIEMYEVQMLLDDAEEIGRPVRLRRIAFPTPRLIPRTRQSERVRRSIANNRAAQTEAVTSTWTQTTQRRKKKKAKRPKRKYRTVYEVDPSTGETVEVKKLVRKRRKAKRKKIKNLRERVNRAKSVKKRLALQLGMCRPPAGVPQATPDMKVPPNASTGSGAVSSQRYKAAIPTLHLFGQRDELDYFSPSDNDEVDGIGGSSVLTRRRPNRSDAALLRRRAQTKSVILPTNSVSSSSDVLGNILNAQERFHSRNTVFSLDQNGTFTMIPTKKGQQLTDFGASVRKNHGSPSSGSGSNNSDSIPTSSGGGGDSHYQPPLTRSPEGGSTAPTSTVEGNLPRDAVGVAERYEGPSEYTQQPPESNSDSKKDTRSPSPESDSDIDIYSDIETVSTSKADEGEFRNTPPQSVHHTPNTATDEDNNDSEPDMVIDTDKPLAESEENTKEETAVTSTVDVGATAQVPAVISSISVDSTSELQSQAVQSSIDENFDNIVISTPPDEEDDSEDECPNFSIYSKESITMAQNTDCTLNPSNETAGSSSNQVGEISSSPSVKLGNNAGENCENATTRPQVAKSTGGGLYSDSEDETIVKKKTAFALGDIRNMTEDISEEERSYTPCLDERGPGLDGLETEMISDEDRDDFDESHDLKTVSDGDALEINAKESEMDLTRPEDYEEGEIVDKSKANNETPKPALKEDEKEEEEPKVKADEEPTKRPAKESKKDKSGNNKENEEKTKETSFKKLSKSNKERNYRDKDKDKEKDKERSKSRDRRRSRSRDRRKEKRKEIQRYNVRAVIAVKPRRLKDKFGRDIVRPSESRSKSPSPVDKSPRRKSRSLSKARKTKRSKRSLSKSPERKRSRSRGKKRKRSKSRERRRKSRERSAPRNKKATSRSRHRTRSPVSPVPANKRRQEWTRRQSRDWSRSISPSRSPEPRHFTPSWTPPRMIETAVQPRNLTVILTNDASKKKSKEKKKKGEKKTKENERQKKRKRNERTPPPSKEVFASGDNILVSVSFNKDNETRDVSTKRKTREKEEAPPPAKKKKEKRLKPTAANAKKPTRDLTGIKPVAIIDLERSPFKELTPSPKDVIVLSDSDGEESRQKICDSSQQVGSPERTGPKTPPEPQVKFTLTSKPPQLRAISNPLHDPLDVEVEGDTQEVDDVHIGPNTPPEPSNSPPSSPDAYDPFEPTKSRSPTPETSQNNSVAGVGSKDDKREDVSAEARTSLGETGEKSSVGQTPEALKSHTPPLADVQPADSQSSTHASPESNLGKSPERVTPLQSSQSQSSAFSGSVAQTVPFSSVPTSIISSTPVSSNLTTSARINLLSSTLITPLSSSASSMPRIVLPTVVKSSPVKISPTKAAVKPMPASSKTSRKSASRTQNGAESSGENMILDSPYSPGSSDYEDLFDPPAESPAKPAPVSKSVASKAPTKSPQKIQNAFDSLFGSPFNKNTKKSDSKTAGNNSNKFGNKNNKAAQPAAIGGSSKQVGVKVDEDSLKILDELPNSAVEMQVKDKFLKKLNRQERVVEEVKLVLKPHYNKKHINKDEYKDILRRAVPKICHNKSGEINPTKIKNLIEAYVKKIRHSKKVTSSSSVNPQKV